MEEGIKEINKGEENMNGFSLPNQNNNQLNNQNVTVENKLEIINDKSILTSKEILANDILKNTENGPKERRSTTIIFIILSIVVAIGAILIVINLVNTSTSSNEIKVEDKTGVYCNDEITVFYTDGYYEYYFDCDRKYYVTKGNDSYTLKDALDKEIISISDLETYKIIYNKRSIY